MFYTLSTAEQAHIIWPDVYFTPQYGRAVEISDGGVWECYYIDKQFLYVYLIRDNEIKSPYGYVGMYIYPGVSQYRYEECRKQFLTDISYRGYRSEFVRRNPYLSTFDITDMELKVEKRTFGMNLIDYETYWKKASGDHRNMVNKGIRLKYHCDFHALRSGELAKYTPFRKIYELTMNYNNAREYYYFTDDYFHHIENVSGVFIAYVYKDNEIIGASLFFVYPPYIHYHLSANNRSSNCITDFLLNQVIQYCFVEIPAIRFLHLGGGVAVGDRLEHFKRRICPQAFEYRMYSKTF